MQKKLYCKSKNFVIKNGVKRSKNFSFAANTTYGCGGNARLALYPCNVPQAKQAFDLASNGIFAVLGNGSDVLAADGFYNGTVISTKNLEGIYRVNQNSLCVLAGTKINKLLNYCLSHGFGGLEYLYGIPATAGGAAYMNAGSDGKYIGDDILKVKIYDGKTRYLSKFECNFTHKHSTMCDINALILAVFVKITPNCDKSIIKQKLSDRAKFRAGLPKGKSCGCVFKNYNGLSAGKIIQNCNLANAESGKAKVSDIHCNFIINYGKNAGDVRNLIFFVKREVYNQTGVNLEEEVIYIGDFNDFNG